MNKFHYIDLSLEFYNQYSEEITAAYLKKNIIEAVNHLFGEVCATVTIDILKYNPITRRIILRVPTSHYVKVHSALTLCGYFEGRKCAYKVHKTSPLLLALQGDSRTYEH